MIRKGNKPTGPEVSVPGTARGDVPVKGGSSFAKRVRTRRKKSQAGAAGSAPRATTAGRPFGPKPDKRAPVLTKEQRLAVAGGRTVVRGEVATAVAPIKAPVVVAATSVPATKPAPAAKPESVAPKPQREPDPGYVAVGRVQGPFGLKGELKVLSLTDNPDRFAPKAKLFAGLQPVSVATEREAQGYVYLTLKGFSNRTSVEKFRHALLQVPESELPELEEGEYYRFQLIGLTVVDTAGAVLGTVSELIETGATDVYIVKPAEGPDILLAATDDVVKSVDLVAKRIVVDPPDWR